MSTWPSKRTGVDRLNQRSQPLGPTAASDLRRLLLSVAMPMLIVGFATDSYAEIAGRYATRGQNISVKIQSWGDDCGPRPRSASGGGGKVVDVRRAGAHLSIGGHRTDRCWSRNPRVQRQRATAGTNRWTVVCQTPSGDSRFEHGEYTVERASETTLRFREVSRYDWRLEGDHCQATVSLTRTYERIEEAETPPEEPSNPPPEPPAVEPPSPSKCAGGGGRPARLDVRPGRARVGPGERLCFRALLRDDAGCPVSGTVTWSLGTSGSRNGRISADGCFTAGTSLESAEDSATIVATHEQLSTKAHVTVRFPDISDLVAARLAEGLDAPDGGGAEPVTEARPGAAQGLGETRVGPVRQSRQMLWIVGGLAALAVVMLIAVAIILTRRRRREAVANEFDVEQERLSSSMAVASSKPPLTPETAKKICPTCGRKFTEPIDFCPDDATKLVPAVPPHEEKEHKGSLICPRCRRGYEGNERFCTYDQEELIPYSVWRAAQLEAKRAKKSSSGGMICPKCASRYSQDILFCQKDGTKLEPIN